MTLERGPAGWKLSCSTCDAFETWDEVTSPVREATALGWTLTSNYLDWQCPKCTGEPIPQAMPAITDILPEGLPPKQVFQAKPKKQKYKPLSAEQRKAIAENRAYRHPGSKD